MTESVNKNVGPDKFWFPLNGAIPDNFYAALDELVSDAVYSFAEYMFSDDHNCEYRTRYYADPTGGEFNVWVTGPEKGDGDIFQKNISMTSLIADAMNDYCTNPDDRDFLQRSIDGLIKNLEDIRDRFNKKHGGKND